VHVADYPDFSDCLAGHFAGLQGIGYHANHASFPQALEHLQQAVAQAAVELTQGSQRAAACKPRRQSRVR